MADARRKPVLSHHCIHYYLPDTHDNTRTINIALSNFLVCFWRFQVDGPCLNFLLALSVLSIKRLKFRSHSNIQARRSKQNALCQVHHNTTREGVEQRTSRFRSQLNFHRYHLTALLENSPYLPQHVYNLKMRLLNLNES